MSITAITVIVSNIRTTNNSGSNSNDTICSAEATASSSAAEAVNSNGGVKHCVYLLFPKLLLWTHGTTTAISTTAVVVPRVHSSSFGNSK